MDGRSRLSTFEILNHASCWPTPTPPSASLHNSNITDTTYDYVLVHCTVQRAGGGGGVWLKVFRTMYSTLFYTFLADLALAF